MIPFKIAAYPWSTHFLLSPLHIGALQVWHSCRISIDPWYLPYCSFYRMLLECVGVHYYARYKLHSSARIVASVLLLLMFPSFVMSVYVRELTGPIDANMLVPMGMSRRDFLHAKLLHSPHEALKPGHSVRWISPVYHLESPRVLWTKVICFVCHPMIPWIFKCSAAAFLCIMLRSLGGHTPQSSRVCNMTITTYHISS